MEKREKQLIKVLEARLRAAEVAEEVDAILALEVSAPTECGSCP